MQRYTLVISFLLFSTQLIFSQSPTLVEDYILGPQGSVDARIYDFGGILTYEGTTQNGEHAILQYDKNIDEITVLATDEDFEGNIITISANTEEILILTGEGSSIKNFYRSYENDLSDLDHIYNSGDATLRQLRLYEGYTLILEENTDGTDYTTNIILQDLEGINSDLFIDLPGRTTDYSFTVARGHFILAPEVELIDGKSILAYNFEAKSFVPITNIIPGFEDCGLISRMSSLRENIIYYRCDAEYYYDLNANQYLNIDGGSLAYENEDFIYLSRGADLIRINKATGEEELILDGIISSTRQSPYFVGLTNNNSQIDISYFNFEEEKLYTYPTVLIPDLSYRMTGFGEVQSGVHILVFESETGNGIISKINSESYTEIDAVYNVSFNNRPVAYDEDIYFTHEHPVYGNELFVIDYDVNSTKDIISPSNIKILPNPAQISINIEHPEEFIPVTTTIFDINGMIVKKNTNRVSIDVSNFASGMYLLNTIYSNGKTITERFVVE